MTKRLGNIWGTLVSYENIKRACSRIRRKWAEGHEPDMHDLGVLAAYNGCLEWCNGHYLGKQTVYPLMEEFKWRSSKQEA